MTKQNILNKQEVSEILTDLFGKLINEVVNYFTTKANYINDNLRGDADEEEVIVLYQKREDLLSISEYEIMSILSTYLEVVREDDGKRDK